MFRPKAKYLVIGAILAAAIGLGVSQAQAQWGWRHWGYASYYAPGYSVACSPCDGGWYLGVRPGPVRRLLFGPYRRYYGGYYSAYYGGWGYCSTCCWDPCCCWDSWCCSDVTVYSPAVPATGEPTRAAAKPALEAPEAPVPPKPGETWPGPVAPKNAEPPAGNGGAGAGVESQSFFQVSTRSNSGLLTIYVPVDAKVWINDRLTASTGSQRRYVSYGLRPGYRYKYEVRAHIPRGGKMLEQVKTVYLTAGANEGVAFDFNQAPASDTAGK